MLSGTVSLPAALLPAVARHTRANRRGWTATRQSVAPTAALHSRVLLAAAPSAGAAAQGRGKAVCVHASAAPDAKPTPVVTIDNLSDPLATIVEISFGDLLGELLDTTQSLKNLGLDITRADIGGAEKSGLNRFYVTDAKTSDKIVLSERLEDIRATIIQNMLTYHPESRDSLAAGRRPGAAGEKTLGARAKPPVETSIKISPDASGSRTSLQLTTTDRPGLLVDIVRVLKDCSLNVISANVNTKGLAAEDTFYLTHRGKALSKNMEVLVMNALQYYLTMAEIETTESY